MSKRVTEEMWRKVREAREVLDAASESIGRARRVIDEIEEDERSKRAEDDTKEVPL